MSLVDKILSEEDKEILRGSVDLHVHCGPESIPAKIDAIDLARQIVEYDMKAAVVKNHSAETSSWAVLASKFYGRCIYGSVTLNWDVGGINRYAVRAALGPTLFGESLLRIIWMPTLHSEWMLERQRRQGKKEDIPKGFAGGSRGGISLEEIRPIKLNEYATEFEVVLDMIAKNDLVLATGHISPLEISTAIDLAKTHDVKKIIVTHPIWPSATDSFSDDHIREFAKKGAFIEFVAYASIKDRKAFSRTVKLIQVIGSERCILSSDLGRPQEPIPALGLLRFARDLIEAGISRSDVFTMLKTNPSHLLGIDCIHS